MTQVFLTKKSILLRSFFAIPLLSAFLMGAMVDSAEAASRAKIERRVAKALTVFKEEVDGGESLLNRAAGVLIFPSVKKAGIGIGGEYGEGALQINGTSVAYYSTAAASIGFQLGAQARTQLLLFMEEGALNKFRNSDGWEVGVDGSVALITLGAGGKIDATKLDEPIIGFILNNKGLMYNLSLEGSKITEIER
ncbi:MAG: YSC84-related protein [Sphingomonadales bacterium]|jgi:lipid-binding SYLF domain-containing protein